MNILGLDNGFNFTKTSKDITIASAITEGVDHINDIVQVEFKDKNYVIGSTDGEYIVDADKLKNPETRKVLEICTLTSIGMSYPKERDIEVNIVAGLPIAYYSKQKDDFKAMLENIDSSITINKIGQKQNIRINKVLVYPQSAGVVIKKAATNPEIKKESSIVIDIGGGTWDVSQFQGLQLVKKATYQQGMLIQYSKVSQYLNSNYYTNFKANEIYDLLKRDTFTAEGEKVSIGVVIPTIEKHNNLVIADIKRDFDINNVDNVFIIGGGAEETESYIKPHAPGAVVEKDAQMCNAKSFEYMGKAQFGSME